MFTQKRLKNLKNILKLNITYYKIYEIQNLGDNVVGIEWNINYEKITVI